MTAPDDTLPTLAHQVHLEALEAQAQALLTLPLYMAAGVCLVALLVALAAIAGAHRALL